MAGMLRRGILVVAPSVVAALLLVLMMMQARGLSARAETLATARLTPVAAMPLPAYLEPVADPVFGTPFTRVTDPGQPLGAGMACKTAYCTHRYSSAQAWNADQTLLLITNGCRGYCFLDGRTYAPLFRRQGWSECEWHPEKAELMVCVDGQAILVWAPRTNATTTVYQAPGYRSLHFGPGKGNLSRDGRRLAVRAVDDAGRDVAFAFDLAASRKFPDIGIAALAGRPGSCSISPSGLYVLCTQELGDAEETQQTYVFGVEGDLVQKWSEHHRPGHGDMAIDADGSDVYVGISKSAPDAYHVIKRRLRDGAVTDLAPYGEAQHASLRNVDRPGWVFVTYAGTEAELAAQPTWAPFQQEIVALRLDGSGEIRRIVHTRAAPADYWSEAHGSPSPDGSQVIWSSNWGKAGGPVSDYVARIDWPDKPDTSWRRPLTTGALDKGKALP